MAKYRIKEQGMYFIPQRRFLFIWWKMKDARFIDTCFVTLGQAKSFLDANAIKPVKKYYPYP